MVSDLVYSSINASSQNAESSNDVIHVPITLQFHFHQDITSAAATPAIDTAPKTRAKLDEAPEVAVGEEASS